MKINEEIFSQMKINDDFIVSLRDLFCDTVIKIFGNATSFLDFIENEKYSCIKYDCFLDYDGENYIINRHTGEYINWYKFTHIGRCINISCKSPDRNIPKWFEEFLDEFKKSEEVDEEK